MGETVQQGGSFGTQRSRNSTAIPLASAPAISESLSGEQRDRFAALLVQVAITRDHADFAELFEFYAPRLKSYFLRLGADGALAEQIVQDVMVVVWQTADQFDPKAASVSSWVFRIARARRADAYRIPLRPDVDPPELLIVPTASAEPNSDETALHLEKRVRFRLLSLSLEQREALRLYFYEGRSLQELARQWGVPMAAAEGIVRAAVSKLQEAPNFYAAPRPVAGSS